ncbi:MAG: S8 family serine peptidase [Verrucomicrobiales bacterium]
MRGEEDRAAGEGWISPEEARAALAHGRGKGVRVAVIDSGIDADHPKLDGMALRDSVAIVEEGGRLRVDENAGSDVYGHGTAIAGIVHEVAPEAEVGSFRVLDARNLSRTAIICEGVRQAINRGYHIINCSFGCRGLAKFVLPHKAWIDEAYLRGVHVVAACNNFDLMEPEWPGHFSSVITVNMARTDSDFFFCRRNTLVEFAARGENVEVAWMGGGKKLESGSSFAAPRVTGYLARILSEAPGLPPAHMLDLLHRIADPWSEELGCS